MQQAENFKYGTSNFRRGKDNKCPYKTNLERNLAAVQNAKQQAHVVIVSIHGHQFKDGDKHNSPDFITFFARASIDNGANIVVCHEPYVMRGIEAYGGGLIFHGLGNFILQHESMAWLPEE